MKRFNKFLVIGVVGLTVSLVMLLFMQLIGVKYDLTPYLIPWIVFLIIGFSKNRYVTN